jgi:hypothetical protein
MINHQKILLKIKNLVEKPNKLEDITLLEEEAKAKSIFHKKQK